MRSDTEAAPRIVDVRGRPTQVTRKGTGEPLVYLHSALGETWWTEFDELASERFDVIHPAHPGFDDSGGLNQIDDITDLAFHTLDLLDTLGIDRAALAGTSMGGWLAAEIAVLAPQRVSSLVLIDAAGIGPLLADIWATAPAEMAGRLFADDAHWMAQLLKAIDLSVPNAPELVMPILQSLEASARIAWNPYMHNPKLPGRLHRVGAPTLVVWGERDGLIPVEHGRRYAELIPGARMEIIEGCGHLPPLECPEVLWTLVREHVR